MGIRALVSFQTGEGTSVSSIYIRIAFFSFNLVSKIVTIRQEFSITRDFCLISRRLPKVPFTPDTYSFHSREFPTMDMLYYNLKQYLTNKGVTVEDVLEEGQPPSTYTPAPPPPEQPIAIIM